LNNPGADWREMSGLVPCSGAERRGKVLDEASTAIHGGAAAVEIIKWPSSNTSHASMI